MDRGEVADPDHDVRGGAALGQQPGLEKVGVDVAEREQFHAREPTGGFVSEVLRV
jgi:hypothetical protein